MDVDKFDDYKAKIEVEINKVSNFL